MALSGKWMNSHKTRQEIDKKCTENVQEKREMLMILHRSAQRESNHHMEVGTVPERSCQELYDMINYIDHWKAHHIYIIKNVR